MAYDTAVTNRPSLRQCAEKGSCWAQSFPDYYDFRTPFGPSFSKMAHNPAL